MMAQTITCDICNSEAASVLQTDIATGEVMAVGQSCHFPFYVGVAAAIAETMPAEIRAEYAEAVGKLAALFARPSYPADAFDDEPADPPPAAPDADSASVNGEGIPVTGDGGPQLADGDGDGGQAATSGPPAAPAKRPRNRAGTPR